MPCSSTATASCCAGARTFSGGRLSVIPGGPAGAGANGRAGHAGACRPAGPDRGESQRCDARSGDRGLAVGRRRIRRRATAPSRRRDRHGRWMRSSIACCWRMIGAASGVVAACRERRPRVPAVAHRGSHRARGHRFWCRSFRTVAGAGSPPAPTMRANCCAAWTTCAPCRAASCRCRRSTTMRSRTGH